MPCSNPCYFRETLRHFVYNENKSWIVTPYTKTWCGKKQFHLGKTASIISRLTLKKKRYLWTSSLQKKEMPLQPLKEIWNRKKIECSALEQVLDKQVKITDGQGS